MLASLAAVNILVVGGQDGPRALHVGVQTLAVLACVAVVAWRRNLFLGLVLAVALVAVLRAFG